MDFSILTKYFVVVVLVACLCIGYCIKHGSWFKWIPNDDIPTVLAVIGAVLNVVVSGLSVESAVYGALMGLASTGLHQGFKRWIDGDTEITDDTGEE